jgi:hypothetical protein
VSYDPCRPIQVVVNPTNAPANFVVIVEGTLARASDAAGLQFEVETFESSEGPTSARPAFDPERYGDRWSPVLIAWASPEMVQDLGGDVAGIGGSTSVTSGLDGTWYVSGAIYLDDQQLGVDSRATQSVLLHEIGHLLGLDHTTDVDQLMHASSPRSTLNQGDLAGFAAVGAGDCSPPL